MPDPDRLARRTVTFTVRRRGCTRPDAARLVHQVITDVAYAIGDQAPDLQHWLADLLAALCRHEGLTAPAEDPHPGPGRTPPS